MQTRPDVGGIVDEVFSIPGEAIAVVPGAQGLEVLARAARRAGELILSGHESRPGRRCGDGRCTQIMNQPSASFRQPKGPARIKVNLPLRFCHETLGLDHLHYGLWDGEPLDRQGLESAQARYTETLLAWFPPSVKTVLDVGCGTGATSRLLHERGFEVEGLSPDPYQQELYRRRVGRPFHLGRFQDFEPASPYDLVLMSESSQYVWLDSLFPAVRRTAAGGHLLVADYFTVGDGRGAMAKSGHPLDRYLEKAAAAGLELLRQEDVTERALPTLELANAWADRYLDPSLAMLGDHLRFKYPRLFRLARSLFGGWVERKLREGREQIDVEEFRRVKRYQLLLFRVPPLGGPADR